MPVGSEQPQEGQESVHRVQSIYGLVKLNPLQVQVFRDLANRPMPPLPNHFLKSSS